MPTILVLFGWRLFFYSNEGEEPVHIHYREGDMECNYSVSGGAKSMKKHHVVEDVRFDSGVIRLVVDGKPVERRLGTVSKRLASAPREALEMFEISPSGYGIHWPLLDEDLSIDGLL